jgi:branched-chain amino acid transport system permease protein
MSGKYITSYREDMRLVKTVPQRLLFVAAVVFALAIPFVFRIDWNPPLDFPWRSWGKALNLAMAWAIGAAAFNLLLGYTGQISIAHAAFLIVGALSGAILGQGAFGLGWSFWVILPIAAAVGAVIGIVVGIPALRVRGLYLFMATLAVHFAAIFAFRKYQLATTRFTAIQYPAPSIPTWLHWLPFINPDEDGEFLIKGDFRWYWVLLPITALCILYMVNVLRTREGRAFVAVRDNDVAASLLGINVARSKLMAFAVSSAMVTVSGVLLAYFLTARSDETWSIEIILDVAIMTVVGGFSTILGGVLGAFFFFGAPIGLEWFRGFDFLESIDWVAKNGANLDVAIFGLAIIVVLVFKPEGLAGLWSDVKRYFRQWPFRY